MKSLSGKTILYVLCITAILIAGSVIYFNYNPVESFFFPKCPFLTLTGYKCPGCGSQRAIHALLHLDIRSAFQHNALLIISIPYILLLLITKIPPFSPASPVSPASPASPVSPASTASTASPVSPRFSLLIQHPAIIWSYGVIVLLFWITRNIFDF
jgi:hypothetical protein